MPVSTAVLRTARRSTLHPHFCRSKPCGRAFDRGLFRVQQPTQSTAEPHDCPHAARNPWSVHKPPAPLPQSDVRCSSCQNPKGGMRDGEGGKNERWKEERLMKVAGRMGRGRRKECESGRADFRAKMKVDGQEPVRRRNKIFESSLFCPERNSLCSHLRDNWGSESVREAR